MATTKGLNSIETQGISAGEAHREALSTRRFERRYSRVFWVATLAVTAMIVLIAIAFMVARLTQ
jgi:hypothetical protein